MYLSNLELVPEGTSVVLLYSTNEVMNIFVHDSLVKSIGCSKDCILNLKTSKDFREAEVNSTILPFNSNCWLFKVNLDKSDKVIKDLKHNLELNTTGIYFIITSKYFMYKKVLEELKDYKIMDFYTGYMRKQDMVYVYDKSIPKKSRIEERLFSFFVENYSTDVDSLFKLISAIKEEEIISSESDIVKICGLSGNSIPNFTVKLIDSKMSSDNSRKNKDLTNEKVAKQVDSGRKRIIKNKLVQINQMADIYNLRYIHKVALGTVQALCDLKILYINGNLYKKTLDRNETEGYDDKQLARGMKFWYRIHELPMSELILLRSELEERIWENRMDYELFLYSYYK